MKAPSRFPRFLLLGMAMLALCLNAPLHAEETPSPDVPKKTLTPDEETHLEEVDMGFEKAYELLRADRGEEAEKQFRDTLPSLEKLVGPEDGRTLKRRAAFADMLKGQKKLGEAVDEYRAVLAVRNRLVGPVDEAAMWLRDELATILEATGKFSEAEQELRTVIPQMERLLDPAKEEMLTRRSRLARMLEGQEKYDEEEKELRAILDISLRSQGPGDQQTLYQWEYLIHEVYRHHNYRAALAEYQKALASQKNLKAEEGTHIFGIAWELADFLVSDGHLKEALAVIKEREAPAAKVIGPHHPFTVRFREKRKWIEAELKKQKRRSK